MLAKQLCRRCLGLRAQTRINVFTTHFTPRRFSSKDVKRFYKNVTLCLNESGSYEVNLDQRKLRTMAGTVLQIPNETLAHGVANEWSSQKETIKRHDMHLTALCNTAIDNPMHKNKADVVKSILEFLETDTICYQLDDPPELMELQNKAWGPYMDWFRSRFNVEIEATTGLGVPIVPDETKAQLQQHLESFNFWSIIGYQYAVECTKSVILTTALIDRALTVEQAVYLSRLEAEYQITKWGHVDWHHGMETLSLQSRLAAATLFVHLNCESYSSISKTLNRAFDS